MINRAIFLLTVVAFSAVSAFADQKNVILFIGDGAGLSSLNAASIVVLPTA